VTARPVCPKNAKYAEAPRERILNTIAKFKALNANFL
jgi:hypothetical protein